MKRQIASALIVAALLAGVACSGGGNRLTPQTAPKITLTTPKSVSPASIKAPPMAATAQLPASAMTSRRPDTSVNPPSWGSILGTGTEVAGANDGSIYVLSDLPAGPDKYIWRYHASAWTNIPGLASHIAVAPDLTIYAVNSGGGVYAYAGGNWTSLGGGATAVAAAADSSVFVTSNGGSGDQAIWHYSAGAWTQAPGSGVSLAGSSDTNTHVVNGQTIRAGGIYVLNAIGNIYYLNTDNSFAQIPGTAVRVAETPGGLYALGGTTILPTGNPLYYFDLDAAVWTQEDGAGVSISMGSGNVLLAISATGGIYLSSTNPPTIAPSPTDSPTATPSESPTPLVTETPSPTPSPSPTPTATPTATPTPVPTATAIPDFAFGGPGDSFQFSGGATGSLHPFGAYHNIGYTVLAWSLNVNDHGFALDVETADDNGDTYVNGSHVTFPVDDAVPGATPIVYFQFNNLATFDIIFTTSPLVHVNYLVPFPGQTCYVDQYLAGPGGGYTWSTTGLSGTPGTANLDGSTDLFINPVGNPAAVGNTGGISLPFPPGKFYYAVSCK